MSSNNEADPVTIGRAVELLEQEFPDVTVSSLRFLEREGLLAPERKPGGHRLYSPFDVETVRRIKRWQAERVSLKEIRRRLELAPVINDVSEVVERMTAFLLKEDIPSALAILDDVHQAGTPMVVICGDILTPVMRNLGDDQGNHLIPVDVQMELDQQLIAFFSIATANPGHLPGMPVIVAACPFWERHDMPLRMLVALLTERGADVHFIGAQVDGEFVRDAVARVQPDIVLVSLTVRPPAISKSWLGEIVAIMEPHQKLYLGGIGSLFLQESDAQNIEILGMESYANVVERLLHSRESGTGEG